MSLQSLHSLPWSLFDFELKLWPLTPLTQVALFQLSVGRLKDQSTKTKVPEISDCQILRSQNRFSGGCVERATPVPIPNTEVKPLGADGTARATAWESRKPPGLFQDFKSQNLKFQKARENYLAGFLVIC